MGAFGHWMLVLPIIVGMAAPAAAGEDLAASAVAAAEAAVKEASDERALWTSAEDAMRKARRALQEGNAAVAVEQAHLARKQAELGIAQKSYPLFR